MKRIYIPIEYKESLAFLRQDLLAEWDYEKNHVRPEDIKPGSNLKVHWKCNKGHEWMAQICDRTKKNSRCPYCAGKKASPEYCLETLYHEIAKEWHPKKNHPLTPKDVTPRSSKKVWWLNSEGHEWQAIIGDRTRKNTTSPYASGKKAYINNCLATSFPKIAKEWHPKKNGNVTPYEVTPMSSHKKYWWQCQVNPEHVWESRVADRTSKGAGCPHCSPQYSKLELRIFSELLTFFPDTIHQVKIHDENCDVFIPELSIAIEVDGYPWHITQIERDMLKNRVLKQNGIVIFRVREPDLPPLSAHDLLAWPKCEDKEYELMCIILDTISRIVTLTDEIQIKIEMYKRTNSFANSICYEELLKNYPLPPREQSLAELSPELARLWHTERNQGRTPYHVKPFSIDLVWWLCPTCGYEWRHKVITESKRLKRNREDCKEYCCPRCNVRNNSLAIHYPDIASEWHPDKNGSLTPVEVRKHSGSDVWWMCQKCSYEWRTKVSNRTSTSKTGCPQCYQNEGFKSYASADYNLAVIHPEIAKEWHPKKNGDFKPTDFAPVSGQKVWWQCLEKQHHEWFTKISTRVSGKTRCPFCFGNNKEIN